MTGKSQELQEAWYNYCITNRLIAYGEVPELTEDQIEARCKEQYEKDIEYIVTKEGDKRK